MQRPAVASGSHQIVRSHDYVFGKAKQKKQGAVKPNLSYEASTIVGHILVLMKARKPTMSKSIARLSEFSSELEELLGETALLKGEDEELYAELREALKAHLDPQDLFDELDVQDLANNIWEGRRFQKHATELINAERLNAIKKLAASRPGFLSDKMAKRIGVTGDSIPEDAIGQGVYLGELGVSRELVQAKALLLAADDYLILDKLVANRSARCKAAIKDYSNRRRQAAKDTRLAKAKRERAKLANDNRPTLVKTPDLSW